MLRLHRDDTRNARVYWPRTLAAKGRERLRAEHLHYRERAPQGGTLHCFLLDCSASMLRHGGLALAKALLLGWCEELDRNGERLVVIGFGGDGARLLKAAEVAAFDRSWLDAIPGGGGTPLAAGIDLTEETLRRLRQSSPVLKTACWLLTDGRFTYLPAAPPQADRCVLVDCEESAVPVGRAHVLAERWGAACYRARDLVQPSR